MKNQLIFSYAYSFDKNHYNSMHSHNELEIILYLKADAVSNIDGIDYNICDNSIAIINPGIPHNEFHRNICKNILVRVIFDDFKLPTGVYHTQQSVILEQIMKKILKESDSPQFAYNKLISAKIEELAILIMREIIYNKYNNKKSTDNLNQFYLYLQENYFLKLNLPKTAYEFGLNYDHIRNKFKKLYGMSPSQFLTLKRVQKAATLLENSNKSCTEIAVECGFSDASHFSKLFKRQYGCSPSEFTKR